MHDFDTPASDHEAAEGLDSEAHVSGADSHRLLYRRLWAFCFPLVVSIGLLLLAALPRPDTFISANIESVSVSLRLAHDWTLAAPVYLDSSLYMSGIRELVTEPASALSLIGLDEQSTHSSTMLTALGRQLQVNRLSLPAGAIVEIEPRGDRVLSFYVRDAVVRAEIYVLDTARIGVDLDEELEAREFDGVGLAITAWEEGPVPVRLDIRAASEIELRNLVVDSISFVRERSRAPGDVRFESAILAGVVAVEDAGGRTYTLREEASFTVAQFDGDVHKLAVDRLVRVILEGRAAEVTTGSGRFARSVKPTWLEFLYYCPLAPVLASAFIAVWGLGIAIAGFQR